MDDTTRTPTTELLAKALQEVQAPQWMIDQAKQGFYDDFKSDIGSPLLQLVQDSMNARLPFDFIQSVKDGKFDAQDWEIEEWSQSPQGRSLMDDLEKQWGQS